MWWLRLRRFWWRRKIRSPELRGLINTSLPAASSRFADTAFLVVDLETTSLDPAQGEIASIGWVPIEHGKVILAQAEHHLIAVRQGVGQSAVFHQISDSQLAHGSPLVDIMRRFYACAAGRVLVFHYAQLDWGYLQCVTRKLFQAPLLQPYVDTMEVERHKLLQHQDALEQGVLRLFACRTRYGLPDYPPHNALTDAIATAELLLAQAAYRGSDTRLRDWL